MKRWFFVVVLCVNTFAFAQDKNYAAWSIAPALRRDAHAVKRMEETSFHIINTSETVLKRKWAITVLDDKGDDYAQLEEYYDKLASIRSIDGTLYDGNGKKLKELKNKDISDVSAVDDNNLIDDNRKKVHRFYYNSYPYTVQYEVEFKINNTMSFPQWTPQEGEHLAVEQSGYTIVCPPDYEVRYKQFNYNGDAMVTTGKNKKTMRWEVKDLPAIKRPFASSLWRELTTSVKFAPTVFEIQGYKGNMSTWQEMGKFQYALNNKRDGLPEGIAQKVKELTQGLKNDAEKVKALYEFLQKNTRYISIQMGLGGWQPFTASYVAQKGYGDCKALTNYMHSLLSAAGIASNYVLVWAGEGESTNFMEDFPSRQFNHAILCVPMKNDTIWLECTSSSNAAGYMGAFTGNRKALLIGENGGALVATPHYGIKENTLQRKIVGKIDEYGELSMTTNTVYNCEQQDDLSMIVNQLSKDRVEKILQRSLELSTYSVNSFKYVQAGSKLPELKEELDITAPNYATISGKRLFIVPNILNRNGKLLEEESGRKVDYVFNRAYSDVDDYEIEIPGGYQVESLPQDITIKSILGNYFSSVKLQGNKIIYHRTMEKFAGRFPAITQSEVIRFYGDIYKADRSKVVLVKK
jgi:hypothetical protein